MDPSLAVWMVCHWVSIFLAAWKGRVVDRRGESDSSS
jgi:hypothetical protein